MAIGQQDGFDWRGVALSALGAGVSAGIGQAVQGAGGAWWANKTNDAAIAARAAMGNAISQGIGVATGLQDSFNWRGVAASAVGAVAGHEVSTALGNQIGQKGMEKFGNQLAVDTMAGIASGVAAKVVVGGKIDFARIATDAFGNALGSAFAEQARQEAGGTGTIKAGVSQGDGLSEEDYWNRYGKTEADRYVDTYGGQASNTGNRLRLSSGSPDGIDAKVNPPLDDEIEAIAAKYRAASEGTSTSTTDAGGEDVQQVVVTGHRMTPEQKLAFDQENQSFAANNTGESRIDYWKAGKAGIGIIGNAGGATAGFIMAGAPTGVTQALGVYLMADGAYGVINSSRDFAAAVSWVKQGADENTNSLPRLAATLIAPGNQSAQRAADAASLTIGLFGGRAIVQPLMFSSREITAVSNWAPAAQRGMDGFNLLQTYDAVVPAAETLKKN